MNIKKLLIPLTVSCALVFVSLSGKEAPQIPSNLNGMDTQSLNKTFNSLKNNPKAGKATFYSETIWKNGMQSITSFSGYKVDGKMFHEQERHFELLGDESKELGGKDAAPGAIEEMMYAVGTCISAAANANATLQGVKLTKLEVKLESDIDMHGLFALDPKVRPGLLEFRTKISIAGDADDETLRKIALAGYRYSPVSDTVRKGVTKVIEPEVIILKHKS